MSNKLLAAILICCNFVFAAVEKGPYLLYEGSNSAMTILWQLTSASQGTVKWGKTTSYELGSGSAQAFGNDNQYRYTISGLEPGTIYHYSISGVGDGSFRTAPEESASSVKLFAYGDTRTYPDKHNSVCKGMLNSLNSDPERHTAILFSGDYVSQGGDEMDWKEQFFPRNKSSVVDLQSKLPVVGAVGNHEAERTGGSAMLKKYYPFPHETSQSFYWSCDYGPVHVVFVDQYTASYRTGSAQYNWIKSDLAATDKEWKIMVFHGPGYSASGHENDMDVQNYLQPLCEEYGVDLVLNGDNHYYSRAVVNGVHHVTTGGGGAPLYDPNPSYPYIVKTDKSNHFCEIDVQDNRLTLTAKRASGSTIESFTIEHEAATPTVTLTAPASDTMILMGESVTLTASVKDQGLNVESVCLMINGSKEATDNSAPYSFTWKSDTPDTVEACIRAIIDGTEYFTDTVQIFVVDPANQEFELIVPIAASSDDAEEDEGDQYGDVRVTSSDLEMTEDGTYIQQVGLRFDNVNLPENFKLTGAEIIFTADTSTSGSASLTIKGEAANNAMTFTEVKRNISERTTTNASVVWNPSSWSKGDAGSAQTTDDLSDIVKEIVNRPGWNSGNALSFIITGSGKRVAVSFDKDQSKAPKLKLKYRIASNSAPMINENPSDKQIEVGEEYSVNLTVSDDDAGDSHTWKLLINDEVQAGFDGSYLWTASDAGEYLFEASVADEAGAMDSVFWYVTAEYGTALVTKASAVQADIAITPNPVEAGQSCRIAIAGAESIYKSYSVSILTPLGITLFSTGDVALLGGNSSVKWDLTNMAGRPVSTGSYLAIIRCTTHDGKTAVAKAMIGVKE